MGILNIICLTTDPDSTTFYGFAFADSSDCDEFFNDCTNNVLVRCNPTLSREVRLPGPLVSKVNSTNMIGIASRIYPANFSCAINAHGVSTMFGWTYDRRGSYAQPATTFGVRYDPTGTMDAKYNFQGPGAWMNVAIDKAYKWTGTSTQHLLGYVNNGGTTDLVHTIINHDENKIYVAKVDETTKTLIAAGTWALNETMHGVVTAMGIGNNHLYTFGVPPFAQWVVVQ